MSLELETQPVPLAADADGVVRVGGTRVTLDSVVDIFRQGATPEEIVQEYPSLQLPDVYSVIGYYLRHSAEVDAYFADRERLATAVRAENEARFDPAGIRDRLMARRLRQG
jgi:uncharacterized protein (DUF433 family)